MSLFFCDWGNSIKPATIASSYRYTIINLSKNGHTARAVLLLLTLLL